MQHVVLKIEGMTCGGCARRVDAGLRQLKGVQVDKVDVGMAEIRYDPDATTMIKINTAISEMGFQTVIAGT